MFKNDKTVGRNKEEWPNLPAVKLTRLMANRVARIEVLKHEVKMLQKLIEKKMREE